MNAYKIVLTLLFQIQTQASNFMISFYCIHNFEIFPCFGDFGGFGDLSLNAIYLYLKFQRETLHSMMFLYFTNISLPI